VSYDLDKDKKREFRLSGVQWRDEIYIDADNADLAWGLFDRMHGDDGWDIINMDISVFDSKHIMATEAEKRKKIREMNR
jgi:hypothetical protein